MPRAPSRQRADKSGSDLRYGVLACGQGGTDALSSPSCSPQDIFCIISDDAVLRRTYMHMHLMPKPVASHAYDADAYDQDSTPPTPRSSRGSTLRRHGRRLASDWDLKSRLPSRLILDEHTSLLDNLDGRPSYRAVASAPQSPKKTFRRRNSAPSSERRSGTLTSRVAKAFGAEANQVEGKYTASSALPNLLTKWYKITMTKTTTNRNYPNPFTTTTAFGTINTQAPIGYKTA